MNKEAWIVQIEKDGAVNGPALLRFNKKYRCYERCVDENYVAEIDGTFFEEVGYLCCPNIYARAKFQFIGTLLEAQAFANGAKSIKGLLKVFAEQK